MCDPKCIQCGIVAPIENLTMQRGELFCGNCWDELFGDVDDEFDDEPDDYDDYCKMCGVFLCDGERDVCNDCAYTDDEIDESMDGDFDSGMASAGFGTDEDYGYGYEMPDSDLWNEF